MGTPDRRARRPRPGDGAGVRAARALRDARHDRWRCGHARRARGAPLRRSAPGSATTGSCRPPSPARSAARQGSDRARLHRDRRLAWLAASAGRLAPPHARAPSGRRRCSSRPALPWHIAAGALDPRYLWTLFVDQQWNRADGRRKSAPRASPRCSTSRSCSAASSRGARSCPPTLRGTLSGGRSAARGDLLRVLGGRRVRRVQRRAGQGARSYILARLPAPRAADARAAWAAAVGRARPPLGRRASRAAGPGSSSRVLALPPGVAIVAGPVALRRRAPCAPASARCCSCGCRRRASRLLLRRADCATR